MYPAIKADANIIDGREDQLSKAKQVLATLDHLITEVRLRV